MCEPNKDWVGSLRGYVVFAHWLGNDNREWDIERRWIWLEVWTWSGCQRCSTLMEKEKGIGGRTLRTVEGRIEPRCISSSSLDWPFDDSARGLGDKGGGEVPWNRSFAFKSAVRVARPYRCRHHRLSSSPNSVPLHEDLVSLPLRTPYKPTTPFSFYRNRSDPCTTLFPNWRGPVKCTLSYI